MKYFFEVTIIGVGNIGFRYLEAVLKIKEIFKVNLIEPDKINLENRLRKLAFSNKEISISKKISKSLLNSDLIIVSTNSGERYKVCQKLISLGYSNDLILEKVLFPNLETLLKSKLLLKNYPSKIYVNQWMGKTDLKEITNLYPPFDISIISNNLGILCNSVHYIHLINEIFKSEEFILDLENSYIKCLLDSKRLGYKEMRGKLVWKNLSGSKIFSLEDKALEIHNNDIHFIVNDINESKKFVFSGNKLNSINNKREFNIPFLSTHASDSIKKVLYKKDPQIPTFNISYDQHKMFFNSLSMIMEPNIFKKLKIT